ncbi:MAG: hypothetical protein K2O36_03770 [Ruminococcus sp.]|nr:hypothetical protein [Ruminococcus sp.]
MRIICNGCGKKVKDSESTCPRCGYVLYENVFGNIAEEIDREMQNISEYELNKVQEEMKNSKAKMSFIEFQAYIEKENNCSAPIMPKKRMMYNLMMQKAYKKYLQSFNE